MPDFGELVGAAGEEVVDDVLGPRPDWLGDKARTDAQGLAGDGGHGGGFPLGDAEEAVEGDGEQLGGGCFVAELGDEGGVEVGDLREDKDGEDGALGDAETLHPGSDAVAYHAFVGC